MLPILLVERAELVAIDERAIDLLIIAEPVIVADTCGETVERRVSVLCVDGLALSLIEVEKIGLMLGVLVVVVEGQPLAVYV